MQRPCLSQRRMLLIFVVLAMSWTSFSGYAETINGIVAVVNDEIITLVDVRIIQAFNLYDIKNDTSPASSLGLILDGLIDQKLVIQLTSENISVAQQEINSHIQDIASDTGEERLKLLRRDFGLSGEDLRGYVRELLLYRKIISQKFARSVFVNLKEIQAYYDQVYILQLKKEGIEPKPMVDVLGQIEAAIKQRKVQKQVEEWLRNLRQKADIQLYVDLYPDFFPRK